MQAGYDCRVGDDTVQAQRYGLADKPTDCDRADGSGYNVGGDSRMAMYSINSTSNYDEPTEVTTQWGPVSYVGCFPDRADNTSIIKPERSWTVEQRLQFAAGQVPDSSAAASLFVGLNDDDLWWGATAASVVKDSSKRVKTCAKFDAKGMSQGQNGVALYEIPATTVAAMRETARRALMPLGWPQAGKLFDYGCWKDSDGNNHKDRLFSRKVYNVPARTAIKACALQAATADEKVLWFGVEGGNDSNEKECFIEPDPNNIVPVRVSLHNAGRRDRPATQTLPDMGSRQ